MSLSLEDVRRLGELARVEVTDAELLAVQQQLNGILGLVGELQAADTAGIAPMAHALGRELRLREDAVTEADQHRLFQSIAPQVAADLYLVPKVIE